VIEVIFDELVTNVQRFARAAGFALAEPSTGRAACRPPPRGRSRRSGRAARGDRRSSGQPSDARRRLTTGLATTTFTLPFDELVPQRAARQDHARPAFTRAPGDGALHRDGARRGPPRSLVPAPTSTSTATTLTPRRCPRSSRSSGLGMSPPRRLRARPRTRSDAMARSRRHPGNGTSSAKCAKSCPCRDHGVGPALLQMVRPRPRSGWLPPKSSSSSRSDPARSGWVLPGRRADHPQVREKTAPE
jgi:hypothetical protein